MGAAVRRFLRRFRIPTAFYGCQYHGRHEHCGRKVGHEHVLRGVRNSGGKSYCGRDCRAWELGGFAGVLWRDAIGWCGDDWADEVVTGGMGG